MKKNSYKGAITVYLSIILSAVIMLSGVLMDIVRIKAARVQVQRAANTAAVSILAGFNTQLKNEYGIFALHNSDGTYLNDSAEDYLSKNLNLYMKTGENGNQLYSALKGIIINNRYQNADFIDLYDYDIENIEVTPLYNFTENEITRQQIIEYMKYRAPAQFAEDFMEKINYAASSRELTGAYKLKTNIEKKLGKIEKAMKRLQEHIDQINKFEKRNFDSSPASNSQLMTFSRSIILKEVYKACRRADFGDLGTSEEKAQANAAIERINQKYEEARKQAADLGDLLQEQLQKSIDAVYGASQELKNIEGLSKQARVEIEGLKTYLKEQKQQSKSGNIDSSEIIASMEKDIDKYEKLLDSDNSKSMETALNSNLDILNFLQTNISDLPPWIASESKGTSQRALAQLESSVSTSVIDTAEINALLRELAQDTKMKSIKDAAYRYEAISGILEKSNSGKSKDPRKSTAEAAKKIREEFDGTDSNLKKIENPKLLPSYYENGSYPNKIFSEAVLGEQKDNQQLPVVVENFDVDFDEDSGFVDDGLKYIIDFAQKLKNLSADMRDEIYVNEYILGTFKDNVEIIGSNTDNKENGTFFDKGEVEYILSGNSDEKVNNYLVKGQILLIRFGMNTLHVYSDPQKRLRALEIATAAAGITGFGIPIIHNLIMCAWGTAEAFSDIKQIYNGGKVPFFKTNENWRTDLLPSGFASKSGVQAEGSIMDFDYHDYLRLLLLVEDKETKINRVEDLMQLNIQQSNPEFKLSNSNTYIKLKVKASIRYWSITKLFVPSKYKTEDGSRHMINIEIWSGY